LVAFSIAARAVEHNYVTHSIMSSTTKPTTDDDNEEHNPRHPGDLINTYSVPTFGDSDKKADNLELKGSGEGRHRFKGRRRSSTGSRSLASSIGDSIGNLMDVFDRDSKTDDDEIDPEDTFATVTGANRYDPSIMAPPNAVVDFDLDAMSDSDNSFNQSSHEMDESYVIDEDTGKRICVLTGNSSGSFNDDDMKKNKSHPMYRYAVPSPSPFCKQLIGVCTIPIMIISSVGLLLVAIKSGSSSSVLKQEEQPDGRSSLDILLYNTEMAVNAACTREDASWANLSKCRELCKESMCCLEVSQSKGCYRGNEKSCIAHASCSALLAFPAQITKPYNNEEEKLQLSEELIFLCSESHLNIDISSCQRKCRNHLCCFEEDDQYNCADIKGEECLVHAACESLVLSSGN
jgi:hypothetical protein